MDTKIIKDILNGAKYFNKVYKAKKNKKNKKTK